MPSSHKALMLELKSLQEEPVEGFRITPVEESDLYNWEVAIFGPPNTLYEGGYFKAHIKFPVDYPYLLHPDQSAFPRQQLGPALR
uniref:Ubiquitin-conjugating enzyme E2R 2 n=1 Tax=Salmo trutta TaxID=8032 RepID=A0A673ZH33_SALTR